MKYARVHMSARRGHTHLVLLDDHGREGLKTLCDLWGWEVTLKPWAEDRRRVCRKCKKLGAVDKASES